MSKTIQIPATIEEAITSLNGIGALLTAKEWERAAIVYAFTYEPGIGGTAESRQSKKSHSGQRSCKEFAALGIVGLTADPTVYHYRRAWDAAVQAGMAAGLPGQVVTLPTGPFPAFERASPTVQLTGFDDAEPEAQIKAIKRVMERKPEVAKRIEDVVVQRAGADPVLAGRVFRNFAEHNVKPKEPERNLPLALVLGFGATVYGKVKGCQKDLEETMATLDRHRGDPKLRTLVYEEVDNLERAKRLIEQYADALRSTVGMDTESVLNNLAERR